MTNRIATLRQQPPEIGRLRGGQKNDKNQPERLDTWRATSKNETAVRALASIYGGDVIPWDDRAGEFEVITETTSIDILLPNDALFTAYEMWGSGGNQRRCDGERCTIPVSGPDGGGLKDVDCLCEEKGLNPGVDKAACNVTVRLKVVLPNVPGMGVWMCTSASIYAAMELPSQVDFIEGVCGVRPGMLIPCKLILDHREEKKAWEKFKREYNVPSLIIDESLQRLAQQVESSTPQRAIAPVRQALATATPSGPAPAPRLTPAPARTAPAVENGQPAAAPRTAQGWTMEKLRTIAEANGFVVDEADTITTLGKALAAAGLLDPQ